MGVEQPAGPGPCPQQDANRHLPVLFSPHVWYGLICQIRAFRAFWPPCKHEAWRGCGDRAEYIHRISCGQIAYGAVNMARILHGSGSPLQSGHEQRLTERQSKLTIESRSHGARGRLRGIKAFKRSPSALACRARLRSCLSILRLDPLCLQFGLPLRRLRSCSGVLYRFFRQSIRRIFRRTHADTKAKSLPKGQDSGRYWRE